MTRVIDTFRTLEPASMPRHARRRGFTLTELLVVIAIVLIVSAATLPAVLPLVQSRQVSESALLVQAELSRARDRAIRDGQPSGVRLLPDPPGEWFAFLDGAGNWNPTPAYSRMIAIELGPPHSDGGVLVFRPANTSNPVDVATQPTSGDESNYLGEALMPSVGSIPSILPANPVSGIAYSYAQWLNPGAGAPTEEINRTWHVIFEAKDKEIGTVRVPNTPTSWFWNIRQGDRISIGDSSVEYTIVGPMRVPLGPDNPEGYINWGKFSDPSNVNAYPSTPNKGIQEFLIVLNGEDDDEDGYVDEAFDGLNNDGDVYPASFPIVGLRGRPCVDPGFNGVDDNSNGEVDEPLEMFFSFSAIGGEYEDEPDFPVGTRSGIPLTYTITRQAVPARNSRELQMPAGAVIDLTTWNSTRERSRLPIDPRTGHIDILIEPGGALRNTDTRGQKPMDRFYHFWITDQDDVFEPVVQTDVPYALPMPAGTLVYPDADDTLARRLEHNRRLVTINTLTGQIVTSTLEQFDLTATTPAALALDRPFLAAQSGIREEQ